MIRSFTDLNVWREGHQMALGSLTELQNQLLIANDLNYIDPKSFDGIAEQTVLVQKLLNDLIRSIKNSG
ncbi:hypothetical protein A3J19_03920 [Candidatus Daviesbacteria bacterium RIFCSPLOWO2_02_FULL_41_8]|uniref:Four helix bundle protein n=3 Tax=Candidatus Daviesiibacteriota TaxID=1752718 RepID=A0A1F5NLI9_9BACT|nr:MAG: hypothetical protein A2871_04065 [Candidatus Daviesbacteria bacterium RIFCSPHIGHO2_01_FULL_41_23]OGE33885.1 MAG: hypothetical protein A3D83_00575 [Candidatus Daviesbacteria bacterium RIFCSPHIGHO2_02_FULL_41_10]OGE62284.1 MAG: hypothetical protein A2967_02405 [Candidatus Daviesbacteria bacterium RIFCSPLOWO2_01_FULL_41_32]OGE78382.1 MAG: hypothetical protein A3J19_03920 [Candidatus Daviesbacteria bacterium RIFCSPLOWO2_02_FULL_41_8]